MVSLPFLSQKETGKLPHVWMMNVPTSKWAIHDKDGDRRGDGATRTPERHNRPKEEEFYSEMSSWFGLDTDEDSGTDK